MNQSEKILTVMKQRKGEWINGRYFLQNMMISQYHARIFDLQRQGHVIEPSESTDEFGFKSYRLVQEKKIELTGNEWWLKPEYQREVREDRQMSLI